MHLKGTFKTMYVIFLVDLLPENWWICCGITRYWSSIDEIHILDNKITSDRSMWAIGGHPPVHQPIPFRTVIENCNNLSNHQRPVDETSHIKTTLHLPRKKLSSQESFKNSIQYHPISWCNCKFLYNHFPQSPIIKKHHPHKAHNIIFQNSWTGACCLSYVERSEIWINGLCV